MRSSNDSLNPLGCFTLAALVGCSLQMPRESDVFGRENGHDTTNAGSAAVFGSGGTGGIASESSGGVTSGGTYSHHSAASSSPSGGMRASGGSPTAGSPVVGGATHGSSTAAAGGATATGGVSADDGLIAHYPFDETSGTVAANAVDPARNGTYVGACTHSPGRIGGAVQIRNLNSDVTGTSDWVSLPSGLFSDASAVTIALWVQALSSARSGARAFDYSNGSGEQVYFSPHDTNAVSANSGAHLVVVHSGSTFVELWSTNPDFTDKEWHHVAVAWNAANLELYIDGKSVGSKTTPGVLPSDLGVTSPNWLGRCLNDAQIAFYGQFDDLRIYGRVLSSTEITQVYLQR